MALLFLTNNLATFAAALVVLASCSKLTSEEAVPVAPPSVSDTLESNVTQAFTFTAEPMTHLDGVEVSDTKTWFPEEAITSVRNCNVYVFEADTKKMAYYSDGEKDYPCSGYFDAEAGQTIAPTLKYNHTYDIYFLANVGDLDPETVTDESAMDAIKWELPNWRTKGYDYLKECDSKGKGKHSFPMAKAYLNHNTKTDGTTFKIQRLIGSYKVKKGTVGEGVELTINELKLCNAAVDIHPFRKIDYYSDLVALKNKGRAGYANLKYASKSESTLPGIWDPALYETGDEKIGDMRVSAEELANLNAGGSITLYYLETMNGEATCLSQFYGTQNDTCKCYEFMAENKESEHFLQTIPYLYYEATKKTLTATQSSTFRFYTGMNNTCDFSMPRNTETEVQLSFSGRLLVQKPENWKVDPDDPQYKTLKWKESTKIANKGYCIDRYMLYIKTGVDKICLSDIIDTDLDANDIVVSFLKNDYVLPETYLSTSVENGKIYLSIDFGKAKNANKLKYYDTAGKVYKARTFEINLTSRDGVLTSGYMKFDPGTIYRETLLVNDYTDHDYIGFELLVPKALNHTNRTPNFNACTINVSYTNSSTGLVYSNTLSSKSCATEFNNNLTPTTKVGFENYYIFTTKAKFNTKSLFTKTVNQTNTVINFIWNSANNVFTSTESPFEKEYYVNYSYSDFSRKINGGSCPTVVQY